jgi:hypothetical protein
MPGTKTAEPQRHEDATVSVRVDRALLDTLRPIAARNRRSLTAELSIAIESHVQQEKKEAKR